jgi:hypothetical protein
MRGLAAITRFRRKSATSLLKGGGDGMFIRRSNSVHRCYSGENYQASSVLATASSPRCKDDQLTPHP